MGNIDNKMPEYIYTLGLLASMMFVFSDYCSMNIGKYPAGRFQLYSCAINAQKQSEDVPSPITPRPYEMPAIFYSQAVSSTASTVSLSSTYSIDPTKL